MGKVISPIAIIHTDFSEKFGIPRQSSLVPETMGVITFLNQYRNTSAIGGIEEYSHLWLIWDFSESEEKNSLTVCPPRLGGKIKKGVFATRSPYRPNGLGLSCVKLEQVIMDGNDAKLLVSGVDLLDGTPIYDIKPYLPYADSFPDARGSFGQESKDFKINIDFPEKLLDKVPADKRNAVIHILEQDPRAAYNKGPGFVYGLSYAGFDIRFIIDNNCLKVTDVVEKIKGFEKIK